MRLLLALLSVAIEIALLVYVFISALNGRYALATFFLVALVLSRLPTRN